MEHPSIDPKGTPETAVSSSSSSSESSAASTQPASASQQQQTSFVAAANNHLYFSGGQQISGFFIPCIPAPPGQTGVPNGQASPATWNVDQNGMLSFAAGASMSPIMISSNVSQLSLPVGAAPQEQSLDTDKKSEVTHGNSPEQPAQAGHQPASSSFIGGFPIMITPASMSGNSVQASQMTSTLDQVTPPPQQAQQQKPSLQTQSRILGPNEQYQHQLSGGTAASNMTPVSQEMISGDAERGVNVQDGKKVKLHHHLQTVVRNSRRMEVVNYEQIERVKMMHQRFAEGSRFSFNYNTLLLTASILAGLGLTSNSGTTVIASMLVSPIMGPVVGMAYGATIHDYRLFKQALRTELLSLLWCIAMGVILAACIGPFELAGRWPTPEMFTRGTWQNFFVALPVAFFSGLGVAVSLLDDQVSSLVGVAISASLLPPAVNTGILWTSYAFHDQDWWEPPSGNPVQPIVVPEPVDDDLLDPYIGGDDGDDDLDYEDVRDFFSAGTISILLTLANIVLVAVASMIMFRLKERLPIQSKKVFWNDLGVARKIYRDLAVMENDEDNNSEVSSEVIDGHSGSSSSSSSKTNSNTDINLATTGNNQDETASDSNV